MPFKIGDVVSLMGLTREAVRSYEDVGIIDPRRGDQSKYRFYDLIDLGILIRARRYRAYGFSLRESAHLINGCGTAEVAAALGEQGAVIEREIREKQLRLACLRKWQAIVSDIPKQLGKLEFTVNPAMYAIRLTEKGKLVDGPDLREELSIWVDREPMVFSAGLWGKGSDGCFTETPDMYFAAEAGDMDVLGLPQGPFVEYWPTRPCLHTVVCRSRHGTERDQLAAPVEYLNTQGIKMTGDPMIRTILLTNGKSDTRVYRDLWIPVEEGKFADRSEI